ncbi:hypothetical protein IFM89_015861, partial [Coptis chinensis]
EAASTQRVISNELLAEGTGQGRMETSPSGRGKPTRKSYAAAAAKPKYGRSIDASSLPTPGMQGEYPTICLIEEEVDRGIQYCLKSLVGRLDLVKMDLNKVKALVIDKWALSGECLVTPLGKGYLMFKFDKEEDYTKSLGETEVVNSSQGERLRAKPMTRNQKKKWRKKNRTANEEAPNSEIHPLLVEEHEPRQQEAERAEKQVVGITLEPNPEVLGRSEPQVHRQEMIEVQMELNKGLNIEDGKERHNMEMDGNAENEQGDAYGTSQHNSPAERNTGPQEEQHFESPSTARIGCRAMGCDTRSSSDCGLEHQNSKALNIPFRFKQAWVQHENLREVVERSWKEPLHDAPIRKVVKKLKRLKIVLKEWSWRVFGNTKQHLKELEGELESILKEQEQDPFNSELQNQEIEKAMAIQALKDAEILTLRQKARVTDALEGERNSKYFHAITKMRLAKSQIVEIQDE